MKRIGVILCLAALIVTMSVSVCFGAALDVVDSYPEDGQKNTSIENVGVKLTFSGEMNGKETVKANAGHFSIVDNEGKEIPIRVFYDPKDSKKVMVLADAVAIAEAAKEDSNVRIKDNTEYTLKITGGLVDNEGNTMDADKTITFTTLNQSRNTKVYMIMMFVMFGGMFFFTSRQVKRQQAKNDEEGKVKEEPFNPYKEAKRTGRSVEEVIAAHEKEMAKKAAKEAKKAARQQVDDDDDEEEWTDNYKVKGPRPISAGGSSYITGRKALAEARAAEEARLAERREKAKKKKKK